MCLYYDTKRKPPFTRLCYRYGPDRGRHVEGRWPCGTYPKPARDRRRTETRGNRSVTEMCVCGRKAVDHRGWCEECYIQEQIHLGTAENAVLILASLGGKGRGER